MTKKDDYRSTPYVRDILIILFQIMKAMARNYSVKKVLSCKMLLLKIL